MLDRENMLLNYGTREDLGIFADFHNDEDNGYVKDWHVRIVYEHRDDPKWDEKPIIECYSLDSNQHVASYYVDTFLGRDGWGSRYGYGLDLYGGEPRWKMDAALVDEIRDWAEQACNDAGLEL